MEPFMLPGSPHKERLRENQGPRSSSVAIDADQLPIIEFPNNWVLMLDLRSSMKDDGVQLSPPRRR